MSWRAGLLNQYRCGRLCARCAFPTGFCHLTEWDLPEVSSLEETHIAFVKLPSSHTRCNSPTGRKSTFDVSFWNPFRSQGFHTTPYCDTRWRQPSVCFVVALRPSRFAHPGPLHPKPTRVINSIFLWWDQETGSLDMCLHVLAGTMTYLCGSEQTTRGLQRAALLRAGLESSGVLLWMQPLWLQLPWGWLNFATIIAGRSFGLRTTGGKQQVV